MKVLQRIAKKNPKEPQEMRSKPVPDNFCLVSTGAPSQLLPPPAATLPRSFHSHARGGIELC
jgi:hypothetical protein